MAEITVGIAQGGFVTSYPPQDIPAAYCKAFVNLFTNSEGNAEKRQGLTELASAIHSHITIDNFHELVDQTGNELLFATGAGEIWKLDDGLDTWSLVYRFDSQAKIFSFYIGKKQVFYNGVDRNVYTEDGSTFFELLSLLTVGAATSGVNTTTLKDDTIINWTVEGPAEMDLVYYTNSNAYGLITTVASASITHTPVSTSGKGIGIGAIPVSGADYSIIDTVALNIVPVSAIGYKYDNESTLVTGSNTGIYVVKNVSDFTTTELRVGDYVYNKTQNAVTTVVSAGVGNIDVRSISGSSVGDTVIFLKSSMPICKYGTAHYQRAYMIDARDDQKLRISGPNNVQDLGGTQAGTFDISSLQPKSEVFLSLLSFQRFFVIAGSKHVFFFEGTNPIGTTTAPLDWTQIGMFPTGVLSRTGIVNAGNDIHWVSNNGVKNASLSKTTSQFVNNSTSYQIDKTFRDLLKRLPQDEIIAFHYPRRSWLCFKAGSELYVYNYNFTGTQAEQAQGQAPDSQVLGRWHLFNGPIAQQKCYFIRNNGDLITGGVNGVVSIFDTGQYSDLGAPIKTKYETGWLSLEKNQKSINRKHGKSIKPVFEAGSGIDLNISVEAPYARYSTDSVTINSTLGVDVIGTAILGKTIIGGNAISFDKVPLRWNGEVCKLTFSTNDTKGPFVLSAYTIYFAPRGVS